MQKILFRALMPLAAAASLWASEETGHGGGDPYMIPKLVNFAILAGGIIFLVVKVLNPAFRKQQKQILTDLHRASKRAEAAAAEAARIDEKMAGLEAEIEAMREKARAEMAAETAHIAEATAARLKKVEQSALQEIASAAKLAKADLKSYSAGLAVELAFKKVAARMDDQAQDSMVRRFAKGLAAQGLEKN